MNQTSLLNNITKPKLKAIPLGGLGEIGMNMMLFEYGDDIIAVDCGHMFPEKEMLGIDLVIPDITYLEENKDKLRAILLTHGHDDHIGAVPYLLGKIDVPIYGTPLTIDILKLKFNDFKFESFPKLEKIPYNDPIKLGAFEIEFIHVTHSISNSASLAIKTPEGTIIVSGDFKIELDPIDGMEFDFETFSKYAKEGVLALFIDSTNIEREGHSPSERDITPTIEHLFEQAEHTIIVSTFSSCIHRIQQIIDISHKFGRKLIVNGLNLERNILLCEKTGFLNIPKNLIESVKNINRIPPQKRVILLTGSQGEPLSALSRIAFDDHKDIKITLNDTVIISARIIPGNEKAIFQMINHLCKRGADVYYEWISKTHSSGHGYAEEIKTFINLVKPKFLIPIHGEIRHLVSLKKMGLEMGFQEEDIFILENGNVLEFEDNSAQINDKIQSGRVLVDGKGVGDVGEIILRDRKHLSEDGMLLVVLAIDHAEGEIISGPDIISRGFMNENIELMNQCKEIVLDTLSKSKAETKEDWDVIKEAVWKDLRRFLRKQTDKRPMILPIVIEV